MSSSNKKKVDPDREQDHGNRSTDRRPGEAGQPDKEVGRHNHEDHEGHDDHADHTDHHAHMAEDFKRRFWISLILTLPMLILSPMLRGLFGFKAAVSFGGDDYVLLALATAIFFYGGWPFTSGLVNELKSRQPGMMTLIGLAISVAYVYSTVVTLGIRGKVFYWELATLIDLMLLGHWIEMTSVMGASKALEELVKLMPDKALVVRADGSTEEKSVSELEKGDRFKVKPGEKIPTDGMVREGSSEVDESIVTGESNPVAKKEGDKVVGGTLNGDGSLTVEVEKVGRETFLAQVLETVKQTQESKSKTQNLADRAAFWLTIIAVASGLITLISWLALGSEFVQAMERMVTVMVITCPHALGLAIPLVVSVSTNLAAKSGLLIRERGAFEAARNLGLIAFDKTGTLTEGKFSLAGVIGFADVDNDEVLRLAASLEDSSEHPLARGITVGAEEKGIEPARVTDFEAITGRGVRGKVDGREIMVVSAEYMSANDIEYDDEHLRRHYHEGRTIVFVLDQGELIGALALGDTIRPESRQAVEELHELGIKSVMVTGDKEEAARAVANTLKLDGHSSQILPQDKAEEIKRLRREEGCPVGMTGDGINDAPALAEADLGAAVGAGADVAVETADVVLTNSNPLDMVAVVRLSKATYRKMIQNLLWAAGYNVVAIPLAAGVLAPWGITISPAAGAVLMSLSTIIVAFNARLLTMPERSERASSAPGEIITQD